MIIIEQSGLSSNTVESNMINQIALHKVKPNSFGKLKDYFLTQAPI